MSKRWKNVILFLLVMNLCATADLFVYAVRSNPKSTILGSNAQKSEKYTLYIGTNDKDTYTQLIPTEEAREIVNQICVKYVSGYTNLEANGGWVDESGSLTQEHTLVYEFYDVTEEQLKQMMDEVLPALNQNSILVECSDTSSTYYFQQ